MTSQGNGPPAVYAVKVSEQLKDTIRRLHEQAAQRGRGQQFLAALRAIHDRLRSDPLRFGEPLFRLPALKLLVFQVIVSPVVVDYAVHEEKRLVLVKGVNVLG
jgi:hypothetical protein